MFERGGAEIMVHHWLCHLALTRTAQLVIPPHLAGASTRLHSVSTARLSSCGILRCRRLGDTSADSTWTTSDEPVLSGAPGYGACCAALKWWRARDALRRSRPLPSKARASVGCKIL